MRCEDLTGKRFDRLLVVKTLGLDASGNRLWLCRCDCGGEATKRNGDFRRADRKYFGCKACRGLTIVRATGRDLHTKSPVYKRWWAMMDRCYRQKATNFKWYGGLGVTVCEEWKSFSAFRDWAVASGYAHGLTLERVDSSIGYDPSNCEWISKAENSRRARLPGHYWRSLTVNA